MILGKSVTPCEAEVSVKSYLCTEFNSGMFGIKASGILEVTNKRLLFQAMGKSIKGWSAIHNEVAIADVSEIKIYKGTSFNLPLFILGIILSIAAAAFIKGLIFLAFSWNGVGTFLALAALAYFVYRVYLWAKKEAFSLLINTKGGDGNVVYIAGFSPFAGGNTAASRALTAMPGRDSEQLLKEIGAVILDVQNLGDYGIDKWKGKSEKLHVHG